MSSFGWPAMLGAKRDNALEPVQLSTHSDGVAWLETLICAYDDIMSQSTTI